MRSAIRTIGDTRYRHYKAHSGPRVCEYPSSKCAFGCQPRRRAAADVLGRARILRRNLDW